MQVQRLRVEIGRFQGVGASDREVITAVSGPVLIGFEKALVDARLDVWMNRLTVSCSDRVEAFRFLKGRNVSSVEGKPCRSVQLHRVACVAEDGVG